MNIKELSQAVSDYSSSNPYRRAYADAIAYEILEGYFYDPAGYSRVFPSEITIETVWERVLEKNKEFTVENGFEQIREDIREFLDNEHLWFQDSCDYIDASILWNGERETESVTFGIKPEGWTYPLDEHPSDEAIFYWLDQDEVKDIKEGYTDGEWTIKEIY